MGGIWIRKALPLSTEFLHKQTDGELKQNPITFVLKHNKVIIFILVCHLCVQGSSYYTIYVWLPTFLNELRSDPVNNAYAITIGVMIVGMAFGVFSGYLGDKYSPIRVLLIGGSVFLICVVLLFPVLAYSNEGETVAVMMAIAIFHGLFAGPSSVWAVDQLPDAATRYTALGIGYNISLALFGGTAPLFATAISAKAGIRGWSWVLFGYGVLSLSTEAIVTRCKMKKTDKK